VADNIPQCEDGITASHTFLKTAEK